jgi:hypothetical protein
MLRFPSFFSILLVAQTAAASADTATATEATTDASFSSLPFSSMFFPTAVLHLEQGVNRTAEKCVTVNGKPLCTVIRTCSLESVELTYYRDSVLSLVYLPCDCSATWGGESCECGVVPLWKATAPLRFQNLLTASLRCPGMSYDSAAEIDDVYDFDISTSSFDCLTGESGFCSSGESTTGVTLKGKGGDLLWVRWRCSGAGGDGCRCTAMYGAGGCSCEVCGKAAPGAFRLDCPGGYSADCAGPAFSIWNSSGGGSPSNRRLAGAAAWAAVAAAVLSLALLLPV